MSEIERAAESLADRIKNMSADDPLLKHLIQEPCSLAYNLEASSNEFLRSRGFDISTKPGCIAAIEWLRASRVEEAFWDDDKIDTAADWYIGEARIDGMIKVLENRIHQFFPDNPCEERRK